MKKNFIWPLLWLFSVTVIAGEIRFNNGDRLSGELGKIDNGKLYWLSDSVGEVAIAFNVVQSLSTSTQISSKAVPGPCEVTGFGNSSLNYRCENGQSGNITLNDDLAVVKYVDPSMIQVDYRGKLIASGRHSTGNKEEKSYAIDSETAYRRGNHRHQSKIDFDSVDNDSENAGDRLVLRYSYDRFFRDKWYWYNSIQSRFDEPADIESRYTYGTGVGYQVFDTQSSALSLESGVTYVRESLEDPETPDPDFEASDTFAAWQWTLDYRVLLFGRAELFHKHQLVKSLEESEDWTVETETGVTAPFVGKLYGEVKVDYDVDNSPAEDKRREDTQITVGLGYSW